MFNWCIGVAGVTDYMLDRDEIAMCAERVSSMTDVWYDALGEYEKEGSVDFESLYASDSWYRVEDAFTTAITDGLQGADTDVDG